MAVLGKNTKNIFAAATAAISLAVLTPQFSTQANAEDVQLVAAGSAATAVIQYGSKLEDVDFVVDDMKSLGIPVELKAGYENAACGKVTINGASVEFDQDNIYGGELGAFIQSHVEGKKVYEPPSCNADT